MSSKDVSSNDISSNKQSSIILDSRTECSSEDTHREDAHSETSSRQALLNAAQLLFSTKGYSAVSTRELAEVAGVNLGSIQYYFGSKAKLFIEAVKGLMGEAEGLRELCSNLSKVEGKENAESGLLRLIHALLSHMLRCEGPQACRLMFREVLSDSIEPALLEQIVSTVVDEFARPTRNTFTSLIQQINNDLPKEELDLIIDSIVGQCAFYATHKPFIERMRGFSLTDPKKIEQISSHIHQFSLFALQGIGSK